MTLDHSILKRIVSTIIVSLGLLSAGELFSQVRPAPGKPAWMKSWDVPSVPANYVSKSDLHKVVVNESAPNQLAILRRTGTLTSFHYPGKSLFLLNQSQWPNYPARKGPGSLPVTK